MNAVIRVLALRFCGHRGSHPAHDWAGCHCPGTGSSR
jgi:hypothetical protein